MSDNWNSVKQRIRGRIRPRGDDFKVPGGAARRIALVGGRFAGEGTRWGRGDGCQPIEVIGHGTVWMASGEIRVFTGWAALVEFPVCVPVGRDGFG